MSIEFDEKNYSSKMSKSIQSLKKDISTLRTGRANTNMLNTIKVDVYGQLMPINQVMVANKAGRCWIRGVQSPIKTAIIRAAIGTPVDCQYQADSD